MNRQIHVHYTINVDDEQFNKALKIALEDGYDYADAGKIETITRKLIQEGIDNTFPENLCGIIHTKRIKQ